MKVTGSDVRTTMLSSAASLALAGVFWAAVHLPGQAAPGAGNTAAGPPPAHASSSPHRQAADTAGQHPAPAGRVAGTTPPSPGVSVVDVERPAGGQTIPAANPQPAGPSPTAPEPTPTPTPTTPPAPSPSAPVTACLRVVVVSTCLRAKIGG
jgi:hypothetical protein